MKLRFLCVNHRMELEGNVSKAIQFWQAGFDTGQYYRDHMLWSDALPHLGCAFEVAEILFRKRMIEPEVACDWFSRSALLLASTFANGHYWAQAEEVTWMAINKLEDDLPRHANSSEWVNRYLCDQYRHLNQLITANKQVRPSVISRAPEPESLVQVH